MAIVKLKPTTPGQRGVVKIVTQASHMGKPFAALTESQKRGSGRNHHGRITVRHKRWWS